MVPPPYSSYPIFCHWMHQHYSLLFCNVKQPSLKRDFHLRSFALATTFNLGEASHFKGYSQPRQGAPKRKVSILPPQPEPSHHATELVSRHKSCGLGGQKEWKSGCKIIITLYNPRDFDIFSFVLIESLM